MGKIVEYQIIDAYDLFIKHFDISKDELIKFGMDHIIFPCESIVKQEWEKLKERVHNNQRVYIRKAGRDGTLTELYLKFIHQTFQNYKVRMDPTNNTIPNKIVARTTHFTKQRKGKPVIENTIRNFQVSHIFDNKTKNPYLFEAPWNIIYIPKIIDPFTGHESKGDWSKTFRSCLYNEVFKRFGCFIEDYNNLIEELNIERRVNDFCLLLHDQGVDKEKINLFQIGAIENYSKIDLSYTPD